MIQGSKVLLFPRRLERNDVSWQVCCTSRFCLLLPCSLRLLRSLLCQQDEIRHTCQERSRPMREAFHVSKGFPSIRERPIGSLVAQISALLTALEIRSLIWECLVCLGPLFRQDRPWSPLASTIAPQMHMCGWQVIQPSLNPTATRFASSDIRRPIAVIGDAFNQSPACGAATALSMPVSAGVSHLVCRCV